MVGWAYELRRPQATSELSLLRAPKDMQSTPAALSPDLRKTHKHCRRQAAVYQLLSAFLKNRRASSVTFRSQIATEAPI